MPFHRHVFICVFLILLMDLTYGMTFRTRVTRNEAQHSLTKSVCEIDRYFTSSFKSCPCMVGDFHCSGHGKDYGCLEISVRAYVTMVTETREIVANLFLSEREYLMYKTSDDDSKAVSKKFLHLEGKSTGNRSGGNAPWGHRKLRVGDPQPEKLRLYLYKSAKNLLYILSRPTTHSGKGYPS